ncbi:MAG TPA: YhbY family RNA-binding protein [Candidatus Methanofastidiosa archaeon]|nr:YhbY family RNA-binding protein [Candidatus Methanofastidiosa archaeon]
MSQEKATVIIGKSGVTDTLKQEISNQLKKKKAVKVSLSQDIEDRESFSSSLCDEIGAELLDLRGRKAILYKD